VVTIMLEKIKSLFSDHPRKDKPPVKSNKKKKGSLKCPHHFGYLEGLPKFDSIPQECLTCKKMLECRNVASLT